MLSDLSTMLLAHYSRGSS